jgi:hypothetical protein
MISIFEKIMGICSRIAQSRAGKQLAKTGYFSSEMSKTDTREQDAHLRFLGLSVVEAIISSLVKWSEPSEIVDDSANGENLTVVVITRNPLGQISMLTVLFP